MQELSFKIKREYEDELSNFLLMNDIDAFEVVDSNLASLISNDDKNWDYCDIEEPSDYIEIKCYTDDKNVSVLLGKINMTDIKGYTVEHREIFEKDYINDWKSFFKTIEIEKDFRVVPEWEEHFNEDIVINPGMAFGTGSHETTYLCLKEIARIRPSGTALDIGTGSGILAIAMAKKYGVHVDAYEIDELATKAANENVMLNDVKNYVNIIKKDFTKEPIKKYDFIVSNIFAETLVSMMPHFADRLNSTGLIVFSGIVFEKADMVIKSMKNNNFKLISQNRLNDWVQITGEYLG